MVDVVTGHYGYDHIRWPITSVGSIDVSVRDPGPPERMLTRSILLSELIETDIEIAFRQLAKQLFDS